MFYKLNLRFFNFVLKKKHKFELRQINTYKKSSQIKTSELDSICENVNNKNEKNPTNLSLIAELFLDDSDSSSKINEATNDSNLNDISDLLRTKISVPKICVETKQYQNILQSISEDATPVELPRMGKVTFELFGQPDATQPISTIPCSGCGAHLHCKSTGIPGYLPSEKYMQMTPAELKTTLCQRCWLLKEKNIALDVTVDKHEYRHVLREIKKQPALIIILVDVFDLPNSFYYRIKELIHKDRPVYVIGNKIDLLPSDGEGYLDAVRESLVKLCTKNGFCMKNHIKYVGLISAKTGYGIENLITRLLQDWRLKGHVYIVGCANSGKSTLFNALLSSDFCRSSAREILQRATTSVWPGTTLNLLKFPILNPKPEYMRERYQRLKEQNKHNEERRLESQRHSRSKNPSLIDHIGLSISTPTERAIKDKMNSDTAFVVPSYTFASMDNDLKQYTGEEGVIRYLEATPFKYDDSKFKYWCFDTPGLINENQIINYLNQEELAKVLPCKPLIARTFIVKPNHVLFLSGLSRIDYIQGDVSIYFTVFASSELSIRILSSEEADAFWKTNLGKNELSVPIGNKERIDSLPSLVGKDYELEGIGWDESAADIVLSSLGWAAVTIGLGRQVHLRAYTIGGKGCHMRSPSLLPRAITMRGKRIRGTPSYDV